MKQFFFLLFLLGIIDHSSAQNVGIGTPTPNSSAQLDISSNNKGLLIPRMTTSQRLAISTPANGLMVYDTDKNELYHYNGTNWRPILNGEYWSRGITSRDRIGNSTDSVGIGTLSPTAKLDVRGDVRIVDGTQATGKVLTSDASGNASWQESAFSNSDRIMIRYTGFGTDSLIDGSTTVYDNGGINFNFINTRFTVTKAGLYHFEGTQQVRISGSNIATSIAKAEPFISVNGAEPLALNSSYAAYNPGDFPTLAGEVKIIVPFKIDIYLTAGSYVVFKMSSYFFLGNYANSPGYISAYLISE